MFEALAQMFEGENMNKEITHTSNNENISQEIICADCGKTYDEQKLDSMVAIGFTLPCSKCGSMKVKIVDRNHGVFIKEEENE